MTKSFPSLDRSTLQYALESFSYQLPAAVNYMRKTYPDCYVDAMKATAESASAPAVTILPQAKPQPYQLPQAYKKGEKAQHENVISNTLLQVENSRSIPGLCDRG